ncbi:MAG: GAF domain-containing protein [Bacteroidia bacterium]|nr:GAF domain-containing protein [Bacteroidia bacterium]
MVEVKSPGLEKYQRLIKAVHDLSLAHSLEDVMDIVRMASRELTGSDGTTFILREGDLCYYAEENSIGPLWKGSRFSIDTCVSGWVMKNKKSLAIQDIYKDSRVPHDLYRPTFVKSLVMVPIRISNPIGVIGNYWSHEHLPSSDELEILQSLANITSVTLQNIKTNEELERRVRERTQELENVNKELELFSYSVSHDLRAPLRSINGFMTILLEDHSSKFDKDANDLALRVMNNARQMTKLIDDLLAFFKTGKKSLSKTDIQTTSFVKGIVDELKSGVNDRIIDFSIKNLEDCNADASLLKQVWLNLISNAIKYTSKLATAKIEIGSKRENSKTVYYIKDNGAGFDMKFYDKLFGIFQRLHSPKLFEGNGIGLAIVERIVTSHNGKIWAESTPGEGASFYFTLE